MLRPRLSACRAPRATGGAPPEPGPRAATPPIAEAPPLGRLPGHTRPESYRLALTIVPERDGFEGTVDIDLELTEPRAILWLHGHGHDVTAATFTPTGGEPRALAARQAHDSGVLELRAEASIPAGRGTLHLAFRHPFGTRTNGLYKVVTQGDAYAFTQLEPIWARQAFPCFDEPAFKVPWEVALTVPTGQTAIANAREIGREAASGGLTTVRFAKTPPLPSYLIAFAVGPLDVVEAPPIPASPARAEPLPFRGVAARGRGPELAHALAETPAIVAELERYFGIAYPYDKLDVIAVPDRGGAMENAGAVTFREWLLLIDDETASTEQRRWFAYVMAHELAHQWFGNLVTMPWWDDIWLNEAFATWMGFRTVSRYQPAYRAEVMLLQAVHQAMQADALLSARQIRQPVATEDDIHNAFDAITYRKGGGMLAMFERWLGEETFQRGIQAYLRAHAHGTATATDLTRALGEAAGKDVASPMSTFLMQPGLPNLHVEVTCDGAPQAVVTQSRYLPLGSRGGAGTTGWQVPLCLRHGHGAESTQTCALVTEPRVAIPLASETCPRWLMPNAGGSGYFRWSADLDQLEALRDHGLAQLSDREKLSFADAIEGMVKRGLLDADVAFRLLEPLAAAPQPDVAGAPMRVLGLAREHLFGTPEQPKVDALVRRLYSPRLRALGADPKPQDDPDARLLRRNLLAWLGRAGDATVRRKARRLAETYLGQGGDEALHPEAIDPDLTGTILFVAGRDADSLLFKSLAHHFDTAPDAAVRGDTLNALAAAQRPPLPDVALDMTLGELLKVSERAVPLWVQSQAPETREHALGWLEKNVDRLMDRLPNRQAGWLPRIGAGFCDEAAIARLDTLFGPRLAAMPGGKRELAAAVESIRLCIAERERLTPSLKRLLR
ncbi:MAG: M1 family aminopeptidase [Polyangiaceae bacterium]